MSRGVQNKTKLLFYKSGYANANGSAPTPVGEEDYYRNKVNI